MDPEEIRRRERTAYRRAFVAALIAAWLLGVWNTAADARTAIGWAGEVDQP